MESPLFDMSIGIQKKIGLNNVLTTHLQRVQLGAVLTEHPLEVSPQSRGESTI